MHSYSRLYIHTVFSVKNREPLIKDEWAIDLFKFMGFILNQSGAKTIFINGVNDHVHCLFIINPNICISNTMKTVKGTSSRWINKNKLSKRRFRWQKGFAAFSHSAREYDSVLNYIKNQKNHHLKISTENELKALKKSNLPLGG